MQKNKNCFSASKLIKFRALRIFFQFFKLWTFHSSYDNQKNLPADKIQRKTLWNFNVQKFEISWNDFRRLELTTPETKLKIYVNVKSLINYGALALGLVRECVLEFHYIVHITSVLFFCLKKRSHVLEFFYVCSERMTKADFDHSIFYYKKMCDL